MNEENNFNEVDANATQTYDLNEVNSATENSEGTENIENTGDIENTAAVSEAPAADANMNNPAPVNYVYTPEATGNTASEEPKKKSSPALIIGLVIILVAAVVLATLLILISVKKKNGSIPQEASIPESFSILFGGEAKAEPTPAEKNTNSKKADDLIHNADESKPADTVTIDATPDSGTESGSSAEDTPAPEPTTVPEFNVTTTLGQYKGIEVDYVLEPVSDEDIESELNLLLSDNAEQQDVTRPAQMGDTVVFSCVGAVEGVINDSCTLTDREMVIGEGGMIPGFEDGFIGHSAGESFELPLTFPENYYEDMKGKDVVFTISLDSVKEDILPELTDEFIAENSEYETIEEYKAATRSNLEEYAIEDADKAAENSVMEKLVQNTTFGGEIEEEVEWTTGDLIAYYDEMCNAYYGCTCFEFYSQIYGIAEAEFNSMMREEAEYTVKYRYILAKIIEEENLSYTEEEYNEAFEDLFFNSYGYTSAEEVYEEYPEADIRSYLSSNILNEKATNLVLDSAVYNGK